MGVLAAVLLGSLAAAPALAQDEVASFPRLEEPRVGDVYVFAAQTWRGDDSAARTSSVAPVATYVVRGVAWMHDAEGTPRLTLLLGESHGPWREEAGRWVAGGTRTLLLDLGTGVAFGSVTHSGPGREESAVGTPAAPPAGMTVLPCGIAFFSAALAQVDSLPRACRGPMTLLDAGLPLERIEPDGRFSSDTVLSTWTREEGGAPTAAFWSSTASPIVRQVYQRVTSPEGALQEGVDYLATQVRGAGPPLAEAESSAAPAPEVTVRRGPIDAQGPAEEEPRLPFPLHQAREALAKDVPTQTYLRENPQAVATHVRYQESPSANGEVRAWSFIWSDPSARGHGVVVRQEVTRVEGAREVAHPAAVVPAERADFAPFVLPLGLEELPPVGVTVAAALDIAAARLPSDVGPLDAFTWSTLVRTGAGGVTNTRSFEGDARFEAWVVSAGVSRSTGASPLDLSPPGHQETLVHMDGETGLVLDARSASSEARFVPLLDGVVPAYPEAARVLSEPLRRSGGVSFPVAGGLALVLVTLLALAWEPTRVVLFQVAFVPLYNRLDVSRIFLHPTRRRLLQEVKAVPGVRLADLVARTDAPQGTLRHHLAMLVRAGYLVHEQDAYFVPEHPREEAVRVVRHERTRAVLAIVAESSGGLSMKEVAQRLQVPAPTAYHHLMRLTSAGLLRLDRGARPLRWAAPEPARAEEPPASARS